MDDWGRPPKLLTLVGLYDEHSIKFDYDWRSRFHIPFSPGVTQTWREAWALFLELREDPSSRVAAAMAGWERPVSHEEIALLDLLDTLRAVNWDPKKGPYEPLPRPWPDPNKTRIGRATRPQSEILAALRARAPKSRPPRDARGRFIKRR
ncbi:hypothetical protein EDD28_2391 [Salana multivorans]|uniref:Uncharacterized protein n=1 Tax=Salana multivorans TaxID=120377 RepID=A0A3N2DDC7_9MICO|nr:hypothetical protein EDD28_2391 [Salana multivorans]